MATIVDGRHAIFVIYREGVEMYYCLLSLAIDDFWGMTISASSALMDVFFLEAVEGEGAAAAVIDGLWWLVLLRAVDTDNVFFSAAEEQAVATQPASTTDFCALALFLVGIVEWEEN